jgi:hypothetical protein
MCVVQRTEQHVLTISLLFAELHAICFMRFT